MYEMLTDVQIERPASGTAVVRFVGEHDLATRDAVGTLLTSLVEDNEHVVVDFSEATFVDSTTMHVLLEADMEARRRGRTFRLQLGSAAIVRRAFELSGLPQRLDCVHSRKEALRRDVVHH